ncbi:MAG: metal-dependent hydrolase [Pseudomonadota bacterium]
MKLIWLGHASLRIETGNDVILVDPWLTANPMLEENQYAAATSGATHILVTHGHFDHTADVVQISKDTGAPVHGMIELAGFLHDIGAVEGNAYNMGGTIALGEAKATLVPASHSSSIRDGDTSRYMGSPAGYIFEAEGKTVYISGDTTIMADMEWIADFYKPTVGILSAGGYYTMPMSGAAYAAKRYFNFETVIPYHYRTFPALEQTADKLKEALPGIAVIEPQILEVIEL